MPFVCRGHPCASNIAVFFPFFLGFRIGCLLLRGRESPWPFQGPIFLCLVVSLPQCLFSSSDVLAQSEIKCFSEQEWFNQSGGERDKSPSLRAWPDDFIDAISLDARTRFPAPPLPRGIPSAFYVPFPEVDGAAAGPFFERVVLVT
jgi:hypothetical protein